MAAGCSPVSLGPWRWAAAAGGPRSAVGLGLALAVFLAVLWLLGDLVRAREGTMARLHDANEALARDRDQRDQLVAERERLAVARDVHDVVAHSLSVVVVQADGASYAAEHADRWTRDEAVAALTAIGRRRVARWSRPAVSSASCVRTPDTPIRHRNPASPTSTAWCQRSARPVSRCARPCRTEPRTMSPRRCSWPHTASCRRV